MRNGAPDWTQIIGARSFYVLVAFLALSAIYQIVTVRQNSRVRAAALRRQHDKLREMTVETMAENMKEVIRTGRSSGLVTLDDVKKMWGL